MIFVCAYKLFVIFLPSLSTDRYLHSVVAVRMERWKINKHLVYTFDTDFG